MNKNREGLKDLLDILKPAIPHLGQFKNYTFTLSPSSVEKLHDELQELIGEDTSKQLMIPKHYARPDDLGYYVCTNCWDYICDYEEAKIENERERPKYCSQCGKEIQWGE